MGGHGSGVAAQLKYRRSQLAKPKDRRISNGPIQKEQWVDPKQSTCEELMAIRIKKRQERKRQIQKTRHHFREQEA